jgi:preprotein translocase subunit SecD
MDQKQQNILAIGVILALLVVAVWQFLPLDKKIRKGLDLQGGLSVILTGQATTQTPITDENMNRAEFIVRNRVDRLGVSEASVQRQGADSILVQLPGIQNPQEALKVLGSTGQLEFVDATSLSTSGTIEQGAKVKAGTYKPFLSGEHVKDPRVSVDSATGAPSVTLTFDAEGTKIWADYTTKLVGKQIAIILDGVVQSAPVVNGPILGGDTEISGKFTPDEAKNLALVLQSGALPVTLGYSDSRVVGPTLGQESLREGLMAVLIGLALVAAYMAVYYRGLGLLAWVSLGLFTALFLGILAVMSYLGTFALSLPGLAGMVLTIGLAADTSILILERFKEEVSMGKTMRSAARSGTRHAIGTSLDADLVTFTSAIVLFAVAVGPVRGFALTLMLGIVVDLTVAILFTRSALIMLSESVIGKAPGFFGVKGGGDRA